MLMSTLASTTLVNLTDWILTSGLQTLEYRAEGKGREVAHRHHQDQTSGE